ncbi:hypothetical protein Tco_0643209 [Tanacetum coccineum]
MARSGTDLKMAKLLSFKLYVSRFWDLLFMSSYTHPSIPSDYDVKDAFSSTNAPNYTPTSPDYSRDFFLPEDISPPKDTETLA